jgi:hypothetical protein
VDCTVKEVVLISMILSLTIVISSLQHILTSIVFILTELHYIPGISEISPFCVTSPHHITHMDERCEILRKVNQGTLSGLDSESSQHKAMNAWPFHHFLQENKVSEYTF